MNTQLQETLPDTSAVQYLTFRLDGEAFATEISKVREVLEYTKITRVPRTPCFMRGVINLRGSVVPVIDLRMQFGLPPGKRTIDTCIIILEVNIDEKLTVLGALADSVQEVIDFETEQLSDAPALGTRINNQFISAMGKIDERFVMILDLDSVFKIDLESLSSVTYDYQESYVDEQEDNNEKLIDTDNTTATSDKTEVSSNDNTTNTTGIDLDSAIQKHAEWKLKLHTAITRNEKLEASEISRDDCCILGKWLHGEAKSKFSHLKNYIECRDKHKTFHVEAGRVAKFINDEKYKEAETMLGAGSAYANASSSVATAIISLRKEIG
ncbi:MAG: chemotaxis protein CheW [Gammaproteobacteria bacterium]|nr:chemotaxis protein CheW [Gammaproteobacteria bacterium]